MTIELRYPEPMDPTRHHDQDHVAVVDAIRLCDRRLNSHADGLNDHENRIGNHTVALDRHERLLDCDGRSLTQVRIILRNLLIWALTMTFALVAVIVLLVAGVFS